MSATKSLNSFENRFWVAHPNLPSPLIRCDSSHGKACAEAARVVKCDASAATPLVAGIDSLLRLYAGSMKAL